MGYKIEILPTAWNDLKQIEDYYLIQFGVSTAIKVSESILSSIERLEQFPHSGSITPDARLNELGYRMILSERYAAFYRLIGEVVFIYHIADTRTNYTKLFES